MKYRKIVSLSIAFSFVVLSVTGFLSYFYDYSRVLATVHTVFGLLLTFGVICHLSNNWKPLKSYSEGKILFLVLVGGLAFLTAAYFQVRPLQDFMDSGARSKAGNKKSISHSNYDYVAMNLGKDIELSIDLLRGEHYWHPQMAVWVEDTLGNYLESLYVSKATAQGLFFGGRNKENFKEFDQSQQTNTDYRRVNALPVWSHKRGRLYEDGWVVPTREEPLPDAITGATFVDNFVLNSSVDYINRFVVMVEINVAFDDNEFYSEYDFPDDEVFHNGTGQLGQPSIVFSAEVDMSDAHNYYLMEMIGRGHHSGQTGELFSDLSNLTTANEIVERIVVGIKTSQATRLSMNR